MPIHPGTRLTASLAASLSTMLCLLFILFSSARPCIAASVALPADSLRESHQRPFNHADRLDATSSLQPTSISLDNDIASSKHQGSLSFSSPAFYPPLFYSTAWPSRDGIPGEPLNVIISGHSHPSVLTEEGLLRYAKKIGFEPECLNLHFGDPQSANLADGNSWQPQLMEIRQAYFPIFGSCFESAVGGNHFRAWKQNGTEASSGAWFLAVSSEYDYRRRHEIKPNGYDVGRDEMVTKAKRKHHGYTTYVEYLDLIRPGRRFNHGIPTDGKVALITVNLY